MALGPLHLGRAAVAPDGALPQQPVGRRPGEHEHDRLPPAVPGEHDGRGDAGDQADEAVGDEVHGVRQRRAGDAEVEVAGHRQVVGEVGPLEVGDAGRAERRRHQAVVERRGRAVAEVEPIASCSGPTTWAATKTTARATSGAVSGSPSVTARDQPARRHGDRRRQRPRARTSPTHHATAWPGAARRSAPKNAHSWRRREPVDHRRAPPAGRDASTDVVAHAAIIDQGCAPVLYEWEPTDAIAELIVPDAAVPTPPAPRRPRVAIVTGANHGIGAATAVALAAPASTCSSRTCASTSRRPTPARRTPTAASGRAAADDVLAAIEPLPGSRRRRRGRPPRRRRRRPRSSTRPSASSGRCRSSSTTPAAGSPTRSRRTRPIASAAGSPP